MKEAEYWLSSLIKVDAGMVDTGNRDTSGKPVLTHAGYYAGLIVIHKKTHKKYFLNTHNSEVLLKDYLGYNSTDNEHLTLREIIRSSECITLFRFIEVITVTDLQKYLKENGIVKKRENAEAMHKLAGNIQFLWD